MNEQADTYPRFAEQPASRDSARRRAKRLNIGTLLIVLGLTVGAVIFALPFIWMVLTSIKTDRQIRTIPLILWPDPIVFTPYVRAWVEANFSRFTLNSMIVATVAATSNALLSALMGYTLARMHFRGRNLIFTLILSTLMIPVQIAFIPMFLIVARMPLIGGNNILGQGGSGMLDTYFGLLAPHMVTAFGIFLMRQFMMGFPTNWRMPHASTVHPNS